MRFRYGGSLDFVERSKHSCDLGDFWNFGENGRMRLRDGGWLGRGQFLGRHWEEAPGIPLYNAWCVLLLLE